MDCDSLKIDSREKDDLYHFRLKLAKILISGNHTKRGRPRIQDQELVSLEVKKSRKEAQTLLDILYDGFDHIPFHDSEHKSALRCKLQGC